MLPSHLEHHPLPPTGGTSTHLESSDLLQLLVPHQVDQREGQEQQGDGREDEQIAPDGATVCQALAQFHLNSALSGT